MATKLELLYCKLNAKDIAYLVDTIEISKDKIVTLDVSSIYTHHGYDGDSLTDLNFEMEEK